VVFSDPEVTPVEQCSLQVLNINGNCWL